MKNIFLIILFFFTINCSLNNVSNTHGFRFLETKTNKKELITNNYLPNNYLENISESYYPISNKKFKLFKKFTKSKLKFNITKKLVYSLSIVSFLLIFGFLIFFIFTI